MRSKSRRHITLFNPATGRPRKMLALAEPGDVEEAVYAARQAFVSFWGESRLSERICYLEKIKTAIASKEEQFAQVIMEEIGAPIDFARKQQVQAALNHIDATLSAAKQMVIDQPQNDQALHRVRHEASGVAALITPWNWPLNQVVLKLSGALIAGCTMVLKPSELASDTALLLASCIEDAGLPKGVFNLLIGDGEAGSLLCAHPDVDVISFTGSSFIGQQIAVQAASSFKRVVLELGGKSPNILFADCDLDKAIKQGVAHCMRNSGQSCNAASRMLVERSIYDDAVCRAADYASNMTVDHPHKAGEHLGPLVSKEQWQRVQGFIKTGIEAGARLVAGGAEQPPNLEHGYFIRPTVFADVTPHMVIFRDEIFGPVLTITPFDNEEQAIRLANDTRFGLAGYIQSQDEARANRVAKRLKVGMVQINGSSRIAGAPFGGVKASGIGREAGLSGIRAFQEMKSISGVANH